jgi:hypothetical protein
MTVVYRCFKTKTCFLSVLALSSLLLLSLLAAVQNAFIVVVVNVVDEIDRTAYYSNDAHGVYVISGEICTRARSADTIPSTNHCSFCRMLLLETYWKLLFLHVVKEQLGQTQRLGFPMSEVE